MTHRPAPETTQRLPGMRVLVVVDNPNNQQIAQELLSAEGAYVVLASNGQIGVDAVAAAVPPFDAVLMDVQMPVMDGYTAAVQIRERLGLMSLPIVAAKSSPAFFRRRICRAHCGSRPAWCNECAICRSRMRIRTRTRSSRSASAGPPAYWAPMLIQPACWPCRTPSPTAPNTAAADVPAGRRCPDPPVLLRSGSDSRRAKDGGELVERRHRQDACLNRVARIGPVMLRNSNPEHAMQDSCPLRLIRIVKDA